MLYSLTFIFPQLSDSNGLSYGHNNNNNKGHPTTSRKVIIHRKPSISDSKEENNNNYTELTACADLKNNNSVTVYGENGSSSFQANVGPNGLYNVQPVGSQNAGSTPGSAPGPTPGSKFKRYLSPPGHGALFSTQQYPQGKEIFTLVLAETFILRATVNSKL